MVGYITGTPREQIHLFNESLDEMIAADNIVRFIDAYVEILDLQELGFIMPVGTTGAPPYRTQLKLKIYIYGYLERIRSSRRLENECGRNTELIWLTENLAPDFKTIADFRKDNRIALKNLFKEFLKLCHKLELLSFKSVAIDGSKMRGQNSLNEVYKREQMRQIEESIQEKIDNYLNELDELDCLEQKNGVSVNEEKIKSITERLSMQMKRKEKIAIINGIFEENPDLKTYFASDEACRLQSDKGKIRPGYNVQTAVEDKNSLLAVAEVTNEQNDKKQLTPMLGRVRKQKADLGIEEKTTGIADAGYFTENEILNNKDSEDFSIVVSPAAEGKPTATSKCGKNKKVPSAGYESDDFTYDEKRDVYLCPEGKELSRITKTPAVDRHGRKTHRYRSVSAVCSKCPKKDLCTSSANGRMLLVSANRKEMQDYIENLKTKQNRSFIDRRKEMVEHPFGTIKRSMGYTYFLLRGIEKVQGEFSLMGFVYNLKRVVNIVGVNILMAALQ
jgi:transposase|tara:strand:+ start:598 stop:2109 length:1512 start_codon:yes stop_codon:yes gene_type:complete